MIQPVPINPLAQIVRPHEEVLDETFHMIADRYMNPTELWGYDWGFERLNHITGGIHFGDCNEMTIVAARSSVGKSSFGVSVAINVAIQFKREYPGLEVRIILLEMEPVACMRRIVSQLSEVGIRQLQTGNMTQFEYQRVLKTQEKLKGLPIRWVGGKHGIGTIEQVVRTVSRDKKACGLWLLDHIGIVPTEEARKTGNTTFALGTISSELHRICRSYAPGIILAQLNRESTKRKDPTPNAADIYGADKILQDTDNLILLHRPEMFVPKAEDQRPESEIAYIIVEKQRDGVQNVKLPACFTHATAQWSDIDDETFVELEKGDSI